MSLRFRSYHDVVEGYGNRKVKLVGMSAEEVNEGQLDGYRVTANQFLKVAVAIPERPNFGQCP